MTRLFFISLFGSLCIHLHSQNLTLRSNYTNLTANTIGNSITFGILGNTNTNSTTIAFSAGATQGFDPGLDSLKIAPTNSITPYIASVLGANDYFINNLPENLYSLHIPLRVKVGITGKYVLIRDSSIILPYGSCMFLEDLSDNTIMDFIANASYSFTIDDTTSAPRFMFHVTRAFTSIAINTSCSYKQNGKGVIKGPEFGTWVCNWMDSLGNVLSVHNNIIGSDSLQNLSPGSYPINIVGSLGACNSFADTLIINAAPTLSVNAITTNEKCINSKTGEIDATNIQGGSSPYSYQWSNGSNSAVNNQLNAGVYILYLTDANGCKDTTIYAIQQLSTLSANFTISNDSVSIANPTVTVTNGSSGYSLLNWDFGDGNTSNLNNPSHTYSSIGTYTIELTASDANCVEKTTKTVTVLNLAGITQEALNNDVSISSNPEFIQVTFDLAQEEQAIIKLYTPEGKLIYTKQIQTLKSAEIIPTTNFSSGFYLMNISIGANSLTKKIVVQH